MLDARGLSGSVPTRQRSPDRRIRTTTMAANDDAVPVT
jgi:short subunit fatty acids transporter